MEESKSTKLNFEYFIKMAVQKKISWETLLVFLDDLTPTLLKSKQAIEVLVNELQTLQFKLQGNIDDDVSESVEIIEKVTPNSNEKSGNSHFVVDVAEKEEKITKIRLSQSDKISTPTQNFAEIENPSKEYPEVEMINLEEDDELPNPGIQNSYNKSDTKENENSATLSFQINGEDCLVEFEESSTAFISLNYYESEMNRN